MAARRQIEAGRSHQASTALRNDVHDREEGSRVGVVGDEVKGAEGAHYQGKLALIAVQRKGYRSLILQIKALETPSLAWSNMDHGL